MNRTIIIALTALVTSTAAGFANGYDSGRDIAERGEITPRVYGTQVSVSAADQLEQFDRRLAGTTVQVSTKTSTLDAPRYGNDLR